MNITLKRSCSKQNKNESSYHWTKGRGSVSFKFSLINCAFVTYVFLVNSVHNLACTQLYCVRVCAVCVSVCVRSKSIN